MLDISVVIPAYNEENRLPATLESVYEYLKSSGKSFEILIVDDGSQDKTAAVVESFAKHAEGVRLLTYSPNQGKGYAVRTGILSCLGATILIDDADGSSPISELSKLEQAVGNGFDIAIGSRAKLSTTTKVTALSYRKFLGNTFNAIVQALLLPGMLDTQCGFKLFRRKAAMEAFSQARLKGYGFDVETLYIARIHGYKIEEVPINWNHVDGSKVNVVFDSACMFFEILGIAFSAVLGRYKRLSGPAN